MIVSYVYKFVFIHIPKNAGTYVSDLLLKLDPTAKNIITNGVGHQSYEFIKTMDIYPIIKDFHFFAIIRNPIDQLISWYNFTRPYKIFAEAASTIEQFINHHV